MAMFPRDDNNVRFVLYQHAKLDLYSATCSSLKQQSTGRHVTPLGHTCSYSLMLHA